MEAVGGTQEVDEMKILRKPMKGCVMNLIDTSSNTWQNNYQTVRSPGELDGWSQETLSGDFAFYLQDTIDIAGLTQTMDKALVPAFIDIHQAEYYRMGGVAAPAAEPDSFGFEYILLTSTPFDAEAWIEKNLIAVTGAGHLPTIFGYTANPTLETLSAGQCLFGRFRYLQNDAHTFERIALVKGESFFGHLDPTMADELYLTRIVWMGGTTQVGNIIELPDIQINIHATTEEMNELSQIMELRRSYLLQQNVG